LAITLRNQRALLQKYNIRIVVYPDWVEIKGKIATQTVNKTEKKKTARIICSSGGSGKGSDFTGGFERLSWRT
jgi:hypothetical protein